MTTRIRVAGSAAAVLAAMLLAAVPACPQSYGCEDRIRLTDAQMAPYAIGPQLPKQAPVLEAKAEAAPDPLRLRTLSYAALSLKHKLIGLASYYSSSLDGTLTATGERFRNKLFTAAHLTLPLGTWVDVHAKATGRTVRCRINDRGPYARKFVLDLSQAAARALGVDRAEDRTVEIRVVALPGEEPLPEKRDTPPVAPATTVASAAATQER